VKLSFNELKEDIKCLVYRKYVTKNELVKV